MDTMCDQNSDVNELEPSEGDEQVNPENMKTMKRLVFLFFVW